MTLVMGVVNVTPDSFSDGGRWFDHDAAIAHGRQLISEGAAIVDIGGESTRPGASAVDAAEERRRVVPVVAALAPLVRVSIDTRRASVAEAAIRAGATLINDVSASLWPVAAASSVGWIAMHMRGEPGTMQVAPVYHDVVSEVRRFLLRRVDEAAAAGVGEIWIDPGIGFGKTYQHNLQLLAHLRSLVDTGWPVLTGTSRKSFLGRLAAAGGEPPAPVGDRLEGSVATAVWAALHGAAMVRAHDVAETVQAVRLVTEAAAV